MTTNNFTWKQLGVIITLLGMLALYGGLLQSKVDRSDFKESQSKIERNFEGVTRGAIIQERLEADIKEIKANQAKMLDVLMEIQKQIK